MADLPKNRIAKLRKEKGLTLKALGKAVDMRDNTLSQYETGKREPKLKTWQKLADFLGVTVDYLQGRSEYRTTQEFVNKTAEKAELEYAAKQFELDRALELYSGIFSNDNTEDDIRKIALIMDNFKYILTFLNNNEDSPQPERDAKNTLIITLGSIVKKLSDRFFEVSEALDVYENSSDEHKVVTDYLNKINVGLEDMDFKISKIQHPYKFEYDGERLVITQVTDIPSKDDTK